MCGQYRTELSSCLLSWLLGGGGETRIAQGQTPPASVRVEAVQDTTGRCGNSTYQVSWAGGREGGGEGGKERGREWERKGGREGGGR